jgi:hypothetical protein
MPMTEQPRAALPDDGVRHYSLLCLAGLGVTALALFLRGLDTLAILPALVGVLMMVFRRRFGSVLVLLIVVWLLAAQRWPVYHPAFIFQGIIQLFQPRFGPFAPPYFRPALLGQYEGFGLPDVLLGAGMLAYVAGHYRLVSVTQRIFPTDPRRRLRRDPPEERRSSSLVNGREILMVLARLPVWIGLAWLCWRWLERRATGLDIDDRWWRLIVLAWVFGVLFVVAAALVRYVAQHRGRPEEAALFLQDTLWRETSREQRRINRWFAWARQRQRKKGDI